MNKLELKTDVYNIENIEKACVAYKDYAKIKIKMKNNRIELTFSKCKYNADITIKEFENYLINVENMKI